MTTTNESGTEIVKRDAMGRMQTSPQRRAALLDEFEKSGMGGAAFARMVGVKYQTFAAWAHKRRKERERSGRGVEVGKPSGIKLLEAIVAPSASGACALTIELPGGARIQVATPAQIELACRFLATLGKMEMRGC